MSPRMRRVLAARPVDLPFYRQYVIDHPRHVFTAVLYFTPWSVTGGLVLVVGAVVLACKVFGGAP